MISIRELLCKYLVYFIITKEFSIYQFLIIKLTFTSNLQLPVADVIRHYKNRWQIETAFRDVKQNFGFDTYQIRKRPSLNRFAQLSFVAASLTQLIFTNKVSDTKKRICRLA